MKSTTTSIRLTPPARPIIRPIHSEERWGRPSGLADPTLRRAVYDLQADLQSLIQELAEGPVHAVATEARRYLGEVRREFLRHHRRLMVSARTDDLDPGVIRSEIGELAAHLRAVTLGRSARLQVDTWDPHTLLEGARSIIRRQEARIDAVYEARSFERRPEDGPLQTARRAMLRATRRSRERHGQALTRVVRLRALARYAIVGNLAHQLESIAVLYVQADVQLAARGRHLFDHILGGYRTLLRRSEDPDYPELVTELRTSVETELSSVEEGIDQICKDLLDRASRCLGEGMIALQAELRVAGTLDAGPVYELRNQRGAEEASLRELKTRLPAVQHAVAGGFVHLAMYMDFVAFSARVRVRTQAVLSELTGDVRGRSTRQIDRVCASLREVLAGEAFQEGAEAIDEHTLKGQLAPVEHVLAVSRRTALQLEEQLQAERSVAPLLDALRRESDSLTERYHIPASRLAHSEWSLPEAPAEVEVELARRVLAFIDSDIAPQLLSVAAEGVEEIAPVIEAFDGLERVLLFDPALVEELGAGGDLQAVIGGALRRSLEQLEQLSTRTGQRADQMKLQMQLALRGKMRALRQRVEEVQLTRLPSRRRKPRLGQRIGELRGVASAHLRRMKARLRRWMGDERIHRLRRWLGLFPAKPPPWNPALVAPPSPDSALPLVYGRLFASQAHWAAELVQANEDLVAQARAGLTRGAAGQLRCVAVVGVEGSGRASLLTAIQRADRWKKVIRLAFNEPLDAAALEMMLAEITQEQLVVVSGLHWAYCARPGGGRPLTALMEAILHDAGRNAWLVEMDQLSFSQLSERSVMREVFGTVVRLGPLSPAELARAVLGRHQLSGHQLCFEDRGQREACEADPRVKPGPLQTQYFKALHTASGGFLRTALSMWVASVREVDEEGGQVVVGAVPQAPTQALRKLSEEDVLLLFQIARHGWMDADTFASLYRRSVTQGSAALGRMVGMGLLERNGKCRVRIRPHLRSGLVAVFQERGWLS